METESPPGQSLSAAAEGVPRPMNEVNRTRWGGGVSIIYPPPRHLPTAGKLIRLHLRCRLIRATPPGQEGC